MKLLILLFLVSCGKPINAKENKPPVEEPEVEITKVSGQITKIEDDNVICYSARAEYAPHNVSISCVRK